MIGILIITHGHLGESLIGCAEHVFGKALGQLDHFTVSHQHDIEAQLPSALQMVAHLDSGDGVLILSDVYGATPCNIVTKLLDQPAVAGVAGVNLPMLLAVLNNRQASLAVCVESAVSAGREGVVHFTADACDYAADESNG